MVSNSSPALLTVTGSCTLATTSATITFDEYVPLQWRSYEEFEAIGAGFVRLGNFRSTLLEIAVAPQLQVIRGITITTMDSVSPWPDFSVTMVSTGLPCLSTSFEGWKVVDIEMDFRVSARPGEIVVYWGELSSCLAYAFAQSRFLVGNGWLVGAWFVGLGDEDTRLFLSHANH